MRIALKFAYNGGPFYGYARQPDLRTIEGDLINVLQTKKFIDTSKKACFKSASRTDKGVSAFGNVIAFNTEKNCENILQDCNDLLDHVVIYAKKMVDNVFYPRHAKQRIYQYYLKKEIVSLQTIESIAPLFIGTHNFSNFARIEPHKNPIRSIEKIALTETDSFFILEFHAQTYLWQQIRRIVSSILKVEKQKITLEGIIQALKQHEEQIDFGLADPRPLILKDIKYDFSFDIDTKELEKKKILEQDILKDIKCPCF
jgi:tRNA pseudouridine38-40 synthase